MVGVVVAESFREVLASPLLRRALVEAMLVGALCGVVGVHVVLRRLPFFTVALSHATFPGVVLAAIVGVPLLVGAWTFSIVLVVVVVLLGSVGKVEGTSAIGVVLAGSLGVGTLLVSARAGFTRDLTAFLAGSVLTVTDAQVVVTAVVAVVVLAVLAATHKELLLRGFDPDAADALGYSRTAADLLLFGVVAVVVSTAVPAVGVVLTVALLVAPASAARLWTDRLGVTMVLSALLGAVSGACGLVASHAFDVAAGGAIVLVAVAFFLVSLVVGPAGVVVGRLRGG